jgi:hypothetical protein
MNKLGFTFYPKDWWTSNMFFELDAFERYIYLEMIFYMYQNDGYFNITKEQFERRLITQIKPNTWEKITQQLTQDELGYTHSSIKNRRTKADISRENGKKGGRPKKPKNLEKNPPLEREREREDKKKEKEKENSKNSHAIDFLILHSKQQFEIFKMQNNSLVYDWKKMEDSFNDKIDLEVAQNKIEFDVAQLMPRLRNFCRAWITNQQKKQIKTTSPNRIF